MLLALPIEREAQYGFQWDPEALEHGEGGSGRADEAARPPLNPSRSATTGCPAGCDVSQAGLKHEQRV